MCLVGLVATQQALWIERSLASIFLTKYETWGRIPGIILASITVIFDENKNSLNIKNRIIFIAKYEAASRRLGYY